MEYAHINVRIVKPLITLLHHANPNVPQPRNGIHPHNPARTSLVAALSISTQAQSHVKIVPLDAITAATHTAASHVIRIKPCNTIPSL